MIVIYNKKVPEYYPAISGTTTTVLSSFLEYSRVFLNSRYLHVNPGSSTEPTISSGGGWGMNGVDVRGGDRGGRGRGTSLELASILRELALGCSG